ncbi:MAG: hypothetical protein K5695_14950 [Oscillospiraceae bacterium]|nr:hypothetical protein [Oscillospiraceae bacterium]
MRTIEIELPEVLAERLAEVAAEKTVTVDELLEWLLWHKLRGVENG